MKLSSHVKLPSHVNWMKSIGEKCRDIIRNIVEIIPRKIYQEKMVKLKRVLGRSFEMIHTIYESFQCSQ